MRCGASSLITAAARALAVGDPDSNMIGASAGPDERLPHVPERKVLIQQAFRLEWLTVAWMVIEALVTIGSGVIAGSLTLTAFGLDSVIELISAAVLTWRLTEELRRGEAFSRHAERIASRGGGTLLFALAGYIVLGAAWSLWTHHGGEFSVPGFAVAVMAMPIMYGLARRSHAERSTWPAGSAAERCVPMPLKA
jgi:hypothetical protein